MNKKELELNGYKYTEVNEEQKWIYLHCDEFYQRRIMDGKGTLYFINIYYYRDHDNYESSVQFNIRKDDRTFNVHLLHINNWGVDQLEVFYNKIFQDMECDYYEKSA